MAKKLTAIFYVSDLGTIPCRDFILSLDIADRKIVGVDIATVEFGWPVGMPVCKSLGGGLWEVRSNISNSRIVRIFFVVKADRIALLHGIVKKTLKTPKQDIDTATKRMKEFMK